ncbi:MAG: chorismate-binding protein [Desulforhopalus sp.]|nr:chorismate-binding protein [Desulforhopalus sp.]
MWRLQEPDLEKLLGFLSRQEEFVFLDTSRPDPENCQSFLFINPVSRLLCRSDENLEKFLDDLQLRLNEGYYLAGWVGYEFGAMLEGGISPRVSMPCGGQTVLADIGVFSEPYIFDHRTGNNNFPLSGPLPSGDDHFSIDNIRPNMQREEFVEALAALRRYIAAGDTYQVNYTLKLLFDFSGSIEKFYRVLRRNQSVGYGAYIRRGDERILSFSPELFFRKNGQEITVRPMKGTAQRGRNSGEERENCLALQGDPKNRSENVMIVDLLRNDLARLMHGHGPSRVDVESLFDVESYESLLQMTSTIKAKSSVTTMKTLKLTELFRILFPCGSITGAPKIRTMQIIDELEKGPRGVYTGAIGYFGPDGSAVFNVPIRTVRLLGKNGEMGIGSGITYGSDAEDEWQEDLLKGLFLTKSQPEFHLFETLLWQRDSGYYLLAEHLTRLENAAEFFKFSYNVSAIKERLEEEKLVFTEGCYRVRLALEKDGRIGLTAAATLPPACLALPAEPHNTEDCRLPVINFSATPVDSNSTWQYFKTSRRELYTKEYAKALDQGLYEYIFLNEAGEVTEGCISNLLILSDGRYKTPPVACGLLPGVMRGRLLADSNCPVFEEIITEQQVRAAEAIFICNSVRGVVQVRLRENGSGG